MKKYVRACLMSFTMFCAIPCPFHNWDEESRPLMTLFLPLVGLWIGLLWCLLAFLGELFDLPKALLAAVLAVFPFLITGFMHLDGFLDVTDAVKSWRDISERRRILKDPLAGSFAVAACGVLCALMLGAFLSMGSSSRGMHALILIPVMSRAASGFFVTLLRPMSTSEYAGTYRQGVKKAHVIWFASIMVLVTVLGFVCLGRYGSAPLAVLAGHGLAVRKAYKSLDGMSGDISGYALTVGELCGVIALAILGGMV